MLQEYSCENQEDTFFLTHSIQSSTRHLGTILRTKLFSCHMLFPHSHLHQNSFLEAATLKRICCHLLLILDSLGHRFEVGYNTSQSKVKWWSTTVANVVRDTLMGLSSHRARRRRSHPWLHSARTIKNAEVSNHGHRSSCHITEPLCTTRPRDGVSCWDHIGQ